MTLDLHVAVTGSDLAPGTALAPLRTIGRAAEIARPGDTVIVHEGTYREWVRPRRGGVSDSRRITFTAAPGEHVLITGAEPVSEWEHVSGTVWKAVIPASVFGDFNPFAEEIDGDWIVYRGPDAPRKHLGEVYLDGTSLYECGSLDEVLDPQGATTRIDDWTGSVAVVPDPARTLLVWYAEVGDECTTVWANFQGADPTLARVEVNVRRSVFFPVEHHVDYITVRGFELAHAATPWSPPTADQPGLIGPNWAKGWVIEDNLIHDAKCSAVSLGKEASTGHNFAAERGDKPGYQYQLESVFAARQIGWDREHIGSHVVQRNVIRDCGQNAIVGHLGAVFSTIRDNHIHDIATKREFYGYEIAGIKLHAAIDTIIEHNRIHDCTLGIWLDWQTQGTRVSRNVLYRNSRDLFIEVSHGPYIVDHNILGSKASVEVFSQGGAFVNNLFAGTVSIEPVIERPTPYHRPHSTQVAGYSAIQGGDDRYFRNLFLSGDAGTAYGPTKRHGQVVGYGTSAYDGSPSSMAEYLDLVADPTLGDHERFMGVKQPVYIGDNAYAEGAAAFAREENVIRLDGRVEAEVIEDGDGVFLQAELPQAFDTSFGPIDASALPPVRVVGAHFEEPDGRPARFDIDLTGMRKAEDDRHPVGPLAALRAGRTRLRVW